MMSILEKEDLIKGLPDNVLQQQMQNPTGELPQYLLISEIQRRTDMRKSLQEQPKQESIADQIRMEGIMATRPQMPPQMQPPMGMEQPPMPMEQPPMGMAQGGVVKMRNLGKVPSRSFELAKKAFQAGATVRDVASLLRMSVNDVMSTFGSIIPEAALSPPERYTEGVAGGNIPEGQEFAQPALDFLRPDLSGVEIPSPFDVASSTQGFLRSLPAMAGERDNAEAIARAAALQDAASRPSRGDVVMGSFPETSSERGILSGITSGITDRAKSRNEIIRDKIRSLPTADAQIASVNEVPVDDGIRSFNAFDPEGIPNIEVPATEKGILTNGMPVFQETSIQDDGIRSLIESPGRLLSEAEMPEGRGVVTEASDERDDSQLMKELMSRLPQSDENNRNIFERIPSIMEGIRSFDPSRLFPRTDKGYVYDVYDRKTDPVGDFYKDIASKNQPNPLYSTLGLPLAQEVVEGPGNLMMGEFNTIYQPSGFQGAGSEAQVTGVDDETIQSVPQVLGVNDKTEVDKVIDVDTDVATDTGTADVGGGIASTGSGTPSVTDSGGLIDKILGYVDKPSEAISYADLIEQSRSRAKGEALTQLGLGIMGGSLQKGLSGASKAVSAARDAESKLSLQERIAQRDALDKDKSRDIQALGTAARIQQASEAAAARLKQSANVLQRDLTKDAGYNRRKVITAATDLAKETFEEATEGTLNQGVPDQFKSNPNKYLEYLIKNYIQYFSSALGVDMGEADIAGTGNKLQDYLDKGYKLSPAGQN